VSGVKKFLGKPVRTETELSVVVVNRHNFDPVLRIFDETGMTRFPKGLQRGRKCDVVDPAIIVQSLISRESKTTR
jgi:hypothetical protein